MIQNMRDLGGIRTKDGKIVRKGMLIRSAQLNQAEAEDLDGISAVIDLRTPEERNESPDQTHGREYLPRPIFEERTFGISHEQGADTHGIPDMAVLYGILMKQCAGSFGKVLRTIMEHDFSGGAVLWHCTEGKDRCGMTTALILEALGVDRDAILKDYLRTNEVNLPKAEKIRERLIPTHGEEFADAVYHAYLADERYIRSAWNAMGDDYLTGTLGITKAELDAFRQKALEDG